MEQAKREPPVALHIQPASDQGLTELVGVKWHQCRKKIMIYISMSQFTIH